MRGPPKNSMTLIAELSLLLSHVPGGGGKIQSESDGGRKMKKTGGVKGDSDLPPNLILDLSSSPRRIKTGDGEWITELGRKTGRKLYL